MTLKHQKPIKFKNDGSAIFSDQSLRNSILWYSKRPVLGIKKVFLFGRHYGVSIGDKKIHIHRLLMMYWKKRILKKNEHVHHIDGNKFNNSKSNLKILKASIHLSMTNKGRSLSLSHKLKISESNKKRTGIIMKKRVYAPINKINEMINHGYSIHRISKFFDCDWSTIRSRINQNPELLESQK